MRENSLDDKIRVGQGTFYKFEAGVIRPDADPAHTGVHRDMNVQLFSDSAGCAIQLCQHIPAEYDRTDLQLYKTFITVRKNIPENQNRLADPFFTELLGLLVSSRAVTPQIIQRLELFCNRLEIIRLRFCDLFAEQDTDRRFEHL